MKTAESVIIDVLEKEAGKSRCSRRKVAALAFERDFSSYYVAHNDGPCADLDICERTSCGIESGKRNEIGCTHAERNALDKCKEPGVLVITCAPCDACKALIRARGVERVFIVEGSSVRPRLGEERNV